MNHRNVNQNVNDISDFRVAPHASIDSHILPDQNSVDIFCDVSQEEWKENDEKKKKNDKSQISKMFEWFEGKWIYIRIHWKAALIIGGVILVLIGLFITAALLLTLLPKKNDSHESNNTSSPTKPPESSHGFGRVKSMTLKSYQFKNNVSVIDSIVLDQNRNLLIHADNQIMLLDIENKTLLQSSFSTECSNCKVYNALPECFNNDGVCKKESIFYCCQKCLKSVKAPFCWNYKYNYLFSEGMIIKDGIFNYDNNTFQVEIIQMNKLNCQIQMFTFFENSNIKSGDLLKCVENSNFFVDENLIAASSKENDTSFQWRANIDSNGTLNLYNFDAPKFFIYNFVNSSLANETVLKMKNNGKNSFFVTAFCDQTFSITRITDDGIKKGLSVLQPLPFKIDISLGSLVDWDFYGDVLSVWYFDENNIIYDLNVSFEWQ